MVRPAYGKDLAIQLPALGIDNVQLLLRCHQVNSLISHLLRRRGHEAKQGGHGGVGDLGPNADHLDSRFQLWMTKTCCVSFG